MLTQLRGWRGEDAADLARIVHDPLIARYTQVPSPYGRVEAEMFLAGAVLSRSAIPLAVTMDDALMGSVSLRRDKEFGEVGRIGYFIAACARGRGLASAAVAALAHEALAHGLFSKVEAWIDASNLASIGVVRGIGFIHEGTLTRRARHAGELTDMVVYAVTSPTQVRLSETAGRLQIDVAALFDEHLGAARCPGYLAQ